MTWIPLVSPLFVPADRVDRLQKAVHSGADAVILDLEDGVAADRKSLARENLGRARHLSIPIVVRVNAPHSPHFADDLRALTGARLEAVMLPKYEHESDLEGVREGVGRFVRAIPLIETAAGVLDAARTLRGEGIVQAAFGSLDYAADVGCEHDDRALLFARSTLVAASRAARIAAPLDGVTTALDRPEVSLEDAKSARRLGFGGKLCIHPRQVAEVRQAFTPNEEETTWAREVLARAADAGAQRVGGEMVDAPVMTRARRLLRLSVANAWQDG